MENAKPNAILEISESEVRYLVGYAINGVPEVLFLSRVPLVPGALQNGKIVSRAPIVEAIREAMRIDDEEIARKVDPSIVNLLLPPIGFQAYLSEKETTVVSSSGLVDRVDVRLLIAGIKRERTPTGNEIVEVCPTLYYTDDAPRNVYGTPPLGIKSGGLGMRADVYTLPPDVIHSYRSLVEEAGVRSAQLAVSSVSSAALIGTDPTMPKAYFLVDMGEATTKVALIGSNGHAVGCNFFALGGRLIDEDVSTALEIGRREARKLKERYGYRPAKRREAEVKLESGLSVRLDDLSSAIEKSFEKYDNALHNAMVSVATSAKVAPGGIGEIPAVFVGGASSLRGLSSLLKKSAGTRRAIFHVPHVIGARDPSLASLLGFLVSGASRIDEEASGVSSLSRESA